jgi:hypothetical protein
MFTYEDVSLLRSDFPDILNYCIVGGSENFIITMSIGWQDRKGVNIYEDDIIKFKEGTFRVVYDCPGFALEHQSGKFYEEIEADNCEVIGYFIIPGE